MKLQDIKQAQPDWFSLKNKRFFGDVSYRVLHGKASGEAFLIRSTFAWGDMFGCERKLHWRINRVNQNNYEIRGLIDKSFSSIDSVKDWLKFN